MYKLNISYNDIFWVVDGDNDSGCESDFVEDGLGVDQMESLLGFAFHIGFHVVVQVLRSDVTVRGQDAQDVFLVGGQVAHQFYL